MTTTENQAGKTFEDLLRVVETLRDPGGCPWDAEQTHESLRSHLLEETYETLEAIETGEPAKLAEELGDLLIQVTFHIDMAARAGEFDSEEVISGCHRQVGPSSPSRIRRRREDARRRRGAGTVGGHQTAREGPQFDSRKPAGVDAGAVVRRGGDGQGGEGRVPIDDMAPTANGGEATLDSESDAGRYLMGVARRVEEAGHDPETALRSYGLELRNRIMRAEKAVEPRTLSELVGG